MYLPTFTTRFKKVLRNNFEDSFTRCMEIVSFEVKLVNYTIRTWFQSDATFHGLLLSITMSTVHGALSTALIATVLHKSLISNRVGLRSEDGITNIHQYRCFPQYSDVYAFTYHNSVHHCRLCIAIEMNWEILTLSLLPVVALTYEDCTKNKLSVNA